MADVTAVAVGGGAMGGGGGDDSIGHVLVSVASESTGKAQTCRNELYALFGIW